MGAVLVDRDTREPERCGKCGHFRSRHPGDWMCRVEDCQCFFFLTQGELDLKGLKGEMKP